jgi:hypothetical protein
MKKICVLFKTHFWNEEVEKNFTLLKISCDKKNIDLYLSYDITNNACDVKYDKLHLFSSDLVSRMNFVDCRHIDRNPDIITLFWFHTHYTVLDFYEKNNNYDLYWSIEYDVSYESWDDFFDVLTSTDLEYDFTAPSLKTKSFLSEEYLVQDWWSWWGFHNQNYQIEMGSYFPLVGFSNLACKILTEEHQKGACGFCEVVVPTIIYNKNLKCLHLKLLYENVSKISHKNRFEFLD